MSESQRLMDPLLSDHVSRILEHFAEKKMKVFDLAFFIRDCFLECQATTPKLSFGCYLRWIIEAGSLQPKESSLKLTYYVAEKFPDLRNEEKRLMAFECYRMLANADLPKEERNKLRVEAEKEKMKSSDVNKMIKDVQARLGILVEEVTKDEAQITFENMSQFGKRFRKLFNPSANTVFSIRVLLKK